MSRRRTWPSACALRRHRLPPEPANAASAPRLSTSWPWRATQPHQNLPAKVSAWQLSRFATLDPNAADSRISPRVFPVSTHETVCGSSRREDFCFIVAVRSEDETEIRAGQSTGGTGDEGYPASDAPALSANASNPTPGRHLPPVASFTPTPSAHMTCSTRPSSAITGSTTRRSPPPNATTSTALRTFGARPSATCVATTAYRKITSISSSRNANGASTTAPPATCCRRTALAGQPLAGPDAAGCRRAHVRCGDAGRTRQRLSQ